MVQAAPVGTACTIESNTQEGQRGGCFISSVPGTLRHGVRAGDRADSRGHRSRPDPSEN